jgi:hypothetical protein
MRLFYKVTVLLGQCCESGFLNLPDPDPSIIKQKSKKNLDFYRFVTSL